MIRPFDLVRYAGIALLRSRFRSAMLLVAMAIGVGSVVVLTGLGEGARQFVLGEFAFLGKDVLVMMPGKKETTGGMPPMGATARDITLTDARVLARTVRGIEAFAPVVMGNTAVQYQGLSKDTLVLGTTDAFFPVRNLAVIQGQGLPAALPMDQARSVAVIGKQLKQDLFGHRNAIGEWVRAGDRRFRIIGVTGSADASGDELADDLFVPLASAMALFNTEGLFRVLVRTRPNANVDSVAEDMIRVMKERHYGIEDVTVITPDALLDTFDDVFGTMTLAVAGIGGISMVVAGILIMNVTLISITQRTAEIGLLKALGASGAVVRNLFLSEAALISLAGSLLGVGVGMALIALGRFAFPSVPFAAPPWAVISSVLIAVIAGVLFAWLPARKAARLEPVHALTKK